MLNLAPVTPVSGAFHCGGHYRMVSRIPLPELSLRSARLRHYADRAAKHRIASWRGGEVQQDRREGYSDPSAMAPSHTGMQRAMLSWNIEIDGIWNFPPPALRA